MAKGNAADRRCARYPRLIGISRGRTQPVDERVVNGLSEICKQDFRRKKTHLAHTKLTEEILLPIDYLARIFLRCANRDVKRGEMVFLRMSSACERRALPVPISISQRE